MAYSFTASQAAALAAVRAATSDPVADLRSERARGSFPPADLSAHLFTAEGVQRRRFIEQLVARLGARRRAQSAAAGPAGPRADGQAWPGGGGGRAEIRAPYWGRSGPGGGGGGPTGHGRPGGVQPANLPQG